MFFLKSVGQMVKKYSELPRERRRIWNGLEINFDFFFIEGVYDKVFFCFFGEKLEDRIVGDERIKCRRPDL